MLFLCAALTTHPFLHSGEGMSRSLLLSLSILYIVQVGCGCWDFLLADWLVVFWYILFALFVPARPPNQAAGHSLDKVTWLSSVFYTFQNTITITIISLLLPIISLLPLLPNTSYHYHYINYYRGGWVSVTRLKCTWTVHFCPSYYALWWLSLSLAFCMDVASFLRSLIVCLEREVVLFAYYDEDTEFKTNHYQGLGHSTLL